MTDAPRSDTPLRLKLDKQKQLDIDWADGTHSVYPIAYLRKNCPCAGCKVDREAQKKSRLHVLGKFTEGPITVLSAEPVGNYAIKLHWSDQHGSGIYSYAYLREIAPPATEQ